MDAQNNNYNIDPTSALSFNNFQDVISNLLNQSLIYNLEYCPNVNGSDKGKQTISFSLQDLEEDNPIEPTSG
jgi:hypothetical protein